MGPTVGARPAAVGWSAGWELHGQHGTMTGCCPQGFVANSRRPTLPPITLANGAITASL